jgi:hypothetical protein
VGCFVHKGYIPDGILRSEEERTISLNCRQYVLSCSFAVATVFVMALMCLPALATAQGAGEYDVKAAFLYNFVRFTEWPSEADSRPMSICIIGSDPFGRALDALQGRPVKGKPIAVRRIRNLQEVQGCRVLFIGASEKDRLRDILATVRGFNVLTIGDTEHYARHGVMINFFVEENKVAFEINVDAVRQTDLTITSKLLRLARIVQSSP